MTSNRARAGVWWLIGLLAVAAPAQPGQGPAGALDDDALKAKAKELATELVARLLDAKPDSIALEEPWQTRWPNHWMGKGQWRSLLQGDPVGLFYVVDAERKYIKKLVLAWNSQPAKTASDVEATALAKAMVTRARQGLPAVELTMAERTDPNGLFCFGWLATQDGHVTGAQVSMSLRRCGDQLSAYEEYRPPTPGIAATVTEAAARQSVLGLLGKPGGPEPRVMNACLLLASEMAPKEGPVWFISAEYPKDPGAGYYAVFIDARTGRQLHPRNAELEGPPDG